MKTYAEIKATYQQYFNALDGCVFNGHINEADKRARQFLQMVDEDLLFELEQIEKEQDGIMGIFHVEPTEATRIYSMLVSAFVCEA